MFQVRPLGQDRDQLDLGALPGGCDQQGLIELPVFQGESRMSSPIKVGDHFDAIIFVDETTRARPVKKD